jgi:hypothetical protein
MQVKYWYIFTKSDSSREIKDTDFGTKLRRRIEDRNHKPVPIYEEFVMVPLLIWIESTFAVTKNEKSGRLIHTQPRSITIKNGAAHELRKLLYSIQL